MVGFWPYPLSFYTSLHRLDRDKPSRMDKLQLIGKNLKNGTLYLNKGKVFHKKKIMTITNPKMNIAYECSLGT
jgi:hypothetical protein